MHAPDSLGGDDPAVDDDHSISALLSVSSNTSAPAWYSWAPVMWVLALLTLGIAGIREVFRPPGRSLLPDYRLSCRSPPLRGPPAYSI